MKSSTLFAFLASFVAGSSLARPIDIGTRQSCASGVHVIVARASTEAPGQGIIGAVADEIVERIPGSDSVAVVYPATLTNYLSSESQGVAAMTKLIENYVADCPDSKIVLMGYSQGAHVTGDVLCGSSTSNPLPSNLGQNVAAVIQMGDPSHVVGLPFNVGTSTRNGVSNLPIAL